MLRAHCVFLIQLTYGSGARKKPWAGRVHGGGRFRPRSANTVFHILSSAIRQKSLIFSKNQSILERSLTCISWSRPTMSDCFICKKALSLSDNITVKEKSTQTLIKSANLRNHEENECCLKNKTAVTIHRACYINYSNFITDCMFIN